MVGCCFSPSGSISSHPISSHGFFLCVTCCAVLQQVGIVMLKFSFVSHLILSHSVSCCHLAGSFPCWRYFTLPCFFTEPWNDFSKQNAPAIASAVVRVCLVFDLLWADGRWSSANEPCPCGRVDAKSGSCCGQYPKDDTSEDGVDPKAVIWRRFHAPNLELCDTVRLAEGHGDSKGALKVPCRLR